ncbi:MAG: hypothetical protein IT454_08470 [Planctomycetes bacterium]|nr:hypothetical protein [Planctomycetota bacterium]
MTRVAWYVWVFVAVWLAWLHALQGALVERLALSSWVPDLALVLLLALAAKVERAHLAYLAAAYAAARCATSIDAPVAIVAAALALTTLARIWRGVVELGNPIPRALLAASCACALHVWFALVHHVRFVAAATAQAETAGRGFDPLGELAHAAPGAAASALVALVLGPWLARLPGLGALGRRRPWQVTASSR